MTTDAFNPETDLPVPAVSDAEVKKFLDGVDGKRPYGSKLMAHTAMLLGVVAKDIEIQSFYRLDYTFEDHKVDGLVKAFNRSAHRTETRMAIDAFIAPRLEQAKARHALPQAPRPGF